MSTIEIRSTEADLGPLPAVLSAVEVGLDTVAEVAEVAETVRRKWRTLLKLLVALTIVGVAVAIVARCRTAEPDST